jgi:HPt (histidine-containing phosphotransfer) domain-containing protein
LAVGVNDVLGKPFDPQELYRMLQQWLPSSQPAVFAQTIAPQREASNSALDHTLSQLRTLPDLKVDRAIGRLLNRADIYLEHAQKIVEQTADTEKKIRDAQANNDMAAVHKVIHEMKSLYGSLGADDIAARCAAIEAGLLGGMIDSAFIEELLSAWKPLHKRLGEIFGSTEHSAHHDSGARD